MNLDFDIGRIVATEFGAGRQKPTRFFFVPVDTSVQFELRAMLRRTIDQITPQTQDLAPYQPSEKYASCEYCYLDLGDSLADVFREIANAENLVTDAAFPRDLRDVTCYFVRLTDGEGRRLTAFRRASHFKGVVKKKLLHVVDDTLSLVGSTVFKLDQDFDLIVDSRAVHALRPASLEALGDMKKAILEEVPSAVSEISGRMPYVDFAPIMSYASERIRAARYLNSIRQQNLDDMDQVALAELCRDTGVRVGRVNGKLSVSDGDVMGFLEVLDRRRYRVDLVPEVPEYYRATSRRRVRGR